MSEISKINLNGTDYNISGSGGGGGGLTTSFIEALQEILSEAVYGSDQTDNIDALIYYADAEPPAGTSTEYTSSVVGTTMTLTLDGNETDLSLTTSGTTMTAKVALGG